MSDESSYMWNLEAGFAERMQAFLEAAGGRIEVGSGFRDPATQQRLWDQEVAEWIAKGYPSEADGATGMNTAEEKADDWVARPGSSNHEHGLACDLSFVNDEAKEWAHANAARFGLEFPMSWEPWHIEPLGLAAGKYEGMDEDWDPRGGYTTFAGELNPADRKDRVADFGQVLDNFFSATPNIEADDDPLAAALQNQGDDMSGAVEGEQGVTDE